MREYLKCSHHLFDAVPDPANPGSYIGRCRFCGESPSFISVESATHPRGNLVTAVKSENTAGKRVKS